MKTIAIGTIVLLVIAWLSGCAGSGENGAWTPADTRASIEAINGGIGTYEHARAAYHGQPAPAP